MIQRKYICVFCLLISSFHYFIKSISLTIMSSSTSIQTVKTEARKQRKSIRQRDHKFIIGNPCGPCEWHIEKDIRIFFWFDLIFQSIFVIPAILNLRLYLSSRNPDTSTLRTTTTTASSTTTGGSTKKPAPLDCDVDKIDMAVLYFILDIANLSVGMITDIFLFIGTFPKANWFSLFCSGFFLVGGLAREVLHVYAATLHILRCAPSTYAYELVVRGMCQYTIWGIWIAFEYFFWVLRGRQFVPKRGMMEPPIVALHYVEMDEAPTVSNLTSVSSWSNDALAVGSSKLQVLSATGSKDNVKDKPADVGAAGDEVPGEEKPKRRRSKRKSKRKSKPDDEEAGAGSGSGTASESASGAVDGKK